MARLIDADKLEKDLMDMAHNELMPDYFRQMCMSMAERVSKEPTIEAEPVRHGHWIENPAEYYKEWIKVFGSNRFFAECEYFTDHIACSNCLKKYNYIDNDSTDEWNYCPNCGAKMDGDET